MCPLLLSLLPVAVVLPVTPTPALVFDQVPFCLFVFYCGLAEIQTHSVTLRSSHTLVRLRAYFILSWLSLTEFYRVFVSCACQFHLEGVYEEKSTSFVWLSFTFFSTEIWFLAVYYHSFCESVN